ncbi:hypothetical protein Tco_1191896 [Tanacetum coccineum]
MSSSSSSSHATVTYTSVSFDTDLPSWGIPLMETYESESDAPLSQVHAPEYPEYLAPSEDDIPVEDQPLPASPIALSPGEGEHLAPANSALPIHDYVPSSKETKPFKTDESAATPSSPVSPHNIVPFSQTRLRRARISVRPYTPLSPSTKAHIAKYASAPIPPSPPPLSSPLLLIPYPPLLLPSPTRMDIIPEGDMPLRKRICFTAPSHRFETEESSAAAAARQTRPALAHGVDYGYIDTVDASIRATDGRVMIALEGVNKRITNLAATHRHNSEEFYTRHQDAQDDQALLKAHISTLEREAIFSLDVLFF